MQNKQHFISILASLMLFIPALAFGQDPDVAVNEDQAVASDSTQERDAPTAEAESVSSDAQAEEDVLAPKTLDTQSFESSLPEQVQSLDSERESQKNAMRKLSQAYPDSGQTPTAPVTTASQAPSSTSQSVIIPSASKASERIPRFEHHGYFRTKLNYFGNYDLNTRGTSPVSVPLNSKQRGEDQQPHIKVDGSDAKFFATMRFRYSPTLHIGESIRIAGSFDILDNIVLGTSPNQLRTNWGSDAFFTFNGASAVTGDNFAANAIAVKALYAEADTLIGTFRAGRIPAHWGLGLLYNDGGRYKRDEQILEGRAWKCLDCDTSDAVDRVEYLVREPFFDIAYLQFSWDFVNSGLASYNLSQDSLGQAFDLAESDDVLQFTLSLFDKPISQQEIDERYRKLYEQKKWAFDWGLMFSYRKQDQAADPSAVKQGDAAGATYMLFDKKASAYVLDLWTRHYFSLPKEVFLRLEAEVVGVFGKVKLDKAEDGTSHSITQVGFGLEAEFTWRDLRTGLKTGAAWADNMRFSGHPLVDQNTNNPMGSILRFDPNYRIDEIMFKELMGGINNAYYFNVFAEYVFPINFSQMTINLGGRLDMSTSLALEKLATPGQSRWYGFETDLKIFYEEKDSFRTEIGAGVFVPGAAWTRKTGSLYPILPHHSVYEDDFNASKDYKASVAWNVVFNAIWMF